MTQLATISTLDVSTESRCYDSEGRVSSNTLTLTSRNSYPFVTDYIYDLLDRVQDVRYPAQYGNGNARKVVHHDYDIASRLTSLTYDNQSFASNIVYNAASQTTSLNIGNGTNQIAETYSYGAQTGLLDRQTATRGTTLLLDLSYDYTNANGKRTGQLTKILNNLDHVKDRGYSYDALGRLAQATGGPSASPLWTLTPTIVTAIAPRLVLLVIRQRINPQSAVRNRKSQRHQTPERSGWQPDQVSYSRPIKEWSCRTLATTTSRSPTHRRRF